MAELGPFSVAPFKRKFETFGNAMKQKKPWIGLTQGGSSRKPPGARVAAKDANIQRLPTRKDPNKE